MDSISANNFFFTVFYQTILNCTPFPAKTGNKG